MTYDGKLLARARQAMEREKEQNEALRQRRLDEVYRRIPEIEQIDARMRGHMSDVVRLTLAGRADLAQQLEKLREENTGLQMRRAELLTEAGLPIDYTDEIVSCSICRDTGNVRGEVCECLRRRYNRELTHELSSLLREGDESFENFDLTLYPDTPDPVSGYVPREVMGAVYDGCRKFASNFPNVSANLLLRGGTGLGKTYLSACIARVIAGKGYSVCYDTAASALDAFERQKFSRSPEEGEAASLQVSRMLSCDLMILDDLGTEMVTAMSLSALYTLLNTRLTRGLRMIISTNCDDAELDRRYTPQILSRLRGEFLELPFFGKDIRLLRRENS